VLPLCSSAVQGIRHGFDERDAGSDTLYSGRQPAITPFTAVRPDGRSAIFGQQDAQDLVAVAIGVAEELLDLFGVGGTIGRPSLHSRS